MAGTWNVTRRDFLRAVGIGGATVLATGGRLGAAGSGAPPSTEPDPEQAGWRRPGGPNVEQLAADLEYDIDRIFRFVADEVHYDPYAGVLRGAKGTLWSRAGNSADQAVLLAALLNAALVETRFVTGTLDEAAAARVMAAATIDADTLRRLTAPVFSPDTSREPPADPVDRARYDELLGAIPSDLTRILDTTRSQLDNGLTAILDAVDAAGISVADHDATMPELEATSHVWVQYASGPEWIDLDPTAPGANPGDVLTVPASTLDAIPDEWRHALSITLLAEVVAGGGVAEESLLTHTMFADELVGTPISLVHAKPEGLEAIGVGILGALEGGVEYVPALGIGEAVVLGDGRVRFSTGEGIDAVFGEGGNEGDTIAEWLDLSITAPGSVARPSRREIFDRVGHAARSDGFDPAALPAVEFVDIDDNTLQEFLPMRSIWSLAAVGNRVPWGYFDQDYDIVDVFADLGNLSEGYHFVREALQVELAAELGHRIFADGINVAALTVRPLEVTPDGVRLEVGFDLLARTFGAVPVSGADVRYHPLTTAGVLSHVAERVAAGEWRESTGSAVALPVSVGRVFEEARRQDVELVVVGPGAAASVDDLDVSAEARARMSAASSHGLLIVVPRRSVEIDGRQRSGWWLIDPASGATADELDDGRGPEIIEEGIPLTAEARAIEAFKRLAACVGKHAAVAAIVIGAAGEAAGFGGASAAGGALAAVSSFLGTLGEALGPSGEAIASAIC